MSKHRHSRGIALLHLLGEILRRNRGSAWTIPAKDREGNRVRVQIGVTAQGVTIDIVGGANAVIRPLDVGRLRNLLRAAVNILERPTAALADLQSSADTAFEAPAETRVVTVLDPTTAPEARNVPDLLAREQLTHPEYPEKSSRFLRRLPHNVLF